MKISICSCTYNRKNFVERWIDSLLASLEYKKYSYEIFVHDNASKDGTYEMLQDKPCNLFRSEKNIGKPKSLNKLFEKCEGDYLVSSDSDIIVNKGWTSGLVDFFEKYEKLGIASPMYKENGNSPLLGGDLEYTKKHNKEIYYFGEDLKYNIAGGFTMMPRNAFIEVGGYDDSGLYGGNDAQLNRSMKDHGYRCAYCRNVSIEHMVPEKSHDGYENWKKNVNRKKKDGKYEATEGFWD